MQVGPKDVEANACVTARRDRPGECPSDMPRLIYFPSGTPSDTLPADIYPPTPPLKYLLYVNYAPLYVNYTPLYPSLAMAPPPPSSAAGQAGRNVCPSSLLPPTSPPHPPLMPSSAGKEGKQFGVPMEAEGFVAHMKALLEDVQVREGGGGQV